MRRCLASGLLPVLHGDAVTVTAEGAVEGPVEGEGGLQGTLAPGPSAHGTQGRKAGVQGGEATAGARAAAAGAGPGPGGSGVVRSGILSGDTLVRDLAASLGPQYVVFLVGGGGGGGEWGRAGCGEGITSGDDNIGVLGPSRMAWMGGTKY